MATKRKPPNRATFEVEVEVFGGSTREHLETRWVPVWESEIRDALSNLGYSVKSIKTTLSRKVVR